MLNGITTPQSKNAVSALYINCKLLPFPSKKSCWNEQTINSLLVLMAVYIVSNMCKCIFSIGVDIREIVRLMEVYAMLYKCTYWVLTLYGRSYVIWTSGLCSWITDKHYRCFSLISRYIIMINANMPFMCVWGCGGVCCGE